jgi:hypothetical protein
MLKAAILAGDADAEAAYVRQELGGDMGSPTRAYAIGLAALVVGDDEGARTAAEAMAREGDAFERAAAAIAALAGGNREQYRAAHAAIVDDFTSRDEYLTGVEIADTALVFEALARQRWA